MSAADLPGFRAESSLEMARILTQYMDCPYAVQSRIKEDFDHPPAIRTIQLMRAKHVSGDQGRQRNAEPFKPHEGYYPDDVARSLTERNERFLDALKWERERSAALRSDTIRRPYLVDAAWEREIKKARAA